MAEIVLKIDGVPGECTTDGFIGLITCNSVSFTLTQEVEKSTNAARTVHTVDIEDIAINRNIDKSSTKLMDMLITGVTAKQAYIYVLKAGASDNISQVPFIEYTLDNAMIANQSVNVGEGDLTEDVTLSFTKLTIKYKPQKADGTLESGWQTTNYDVQLGKKV